MSKSSHPGFWGGSTVRDGKVRRLPADNFKEFVERIINIPIHFGMTRSEFWSLPDDNARDRAKDGAFVCSCAFTGESETRRSDSNATLLTTVTLDLDSGDFLKEMEKFPETISEALYPFNHVVWHTAKSRPGVAPRLKVMVEVSPCSPVHLKRFLSHVAFLLGIPSDFKGCKESSIVSQAQYRGILFKGESGTPIITSRVNGVPMQVSDLPELDMEDEEMLNGRTYACEHSNDNDEFFGLAYLPVTDLVVDDIREALNTIDPDCNRPTWLQVAAALRHQFVDEDQAREAYDAFEEWSAKAKKKFTGRKDTWSTWKSLRPYCKGRAPVTIRTLYHFAQEAGWENTKVATKLSQTISDWIASCMSAEELMIEGPTKLAGMPFANAIVEESLVVTLRKRLIALGETIDKNTIKKQINKIRRADKNAKQESRQDELPSWLAPFVYISTLDVFFNMGTGVSLRPSAFDRTYSMLMMPSEETPANGLPIMQPSSYALNILKMLRVDEVEYNPLQPEDMKVFPCKETGKLLLNSYNYNSLPVADPEFSDMAETVLRELLAPLIREVWLVEIMIDYLALQVQFPGRKIPWSFLIQSAPGAGKGTLGEVMEAVLGAVNVKIISPSQMSANFNEWSTGSVFGIFNEVHIPGERRDQVMNAIKPCISDLIISQNLKHRDGECRVKNYTNYIAFTNFKDAAHLASEDRRWCIVFAPMQTRNQVLELQESGHFDRVRWLITPTGASALRYFLLKRKIGDDFPLNGHAPETPYRKEVIAQSKNSLQISVEDVIEDGEEPLIGEQVIHDGRLKQLLCRHSREASLVPRYLSLMGYERYDTKRHMLEGVRGHIWVHTEKWLNGQNPVEFLKKRIEEVPELDAEFS